jgi:hypothetical protein
MAAAAPRIGRCRACPRPAPRPYNGKSRASCAQALTRRRRSRLAARASHRSATALVDRATRAPPPPLTSDSGLLPPSSTTVSTPLRSPRSPLSVLHLTRAPTRPEPYRFDAPGASSSVPVRCACFLRAQTQGGRR